MLLHPGLINAHTHGHGNLAKGMGDRWTLELLLNAAPWIGGGRELEDKYLSTLIGAAEMLLKGTTAAYDLSFEFPVPDDRRRRRVGQGLHGCRDARCGRADGRRHHLLRRHSGPLRRAAGASAEGDPRPQAGARRDDAGADQGRSRGLGDRHATGSARPSRPPSRTIARSASCTAAAISPGRMAWACTAMSPRARCRR